MTAIYIAFNIIMALIVINVVGFETWLGLLLLGAISLAGNYILSLLEVDIQKHKAKKEAEKFRQEFEQARKQRAQHTKDAWRTAAQAVFNAAQQTKRQKAANNMYNRPPTKDVNPNHIERLPKR